MVELIVAYCSGNEVWIFANIGLKKNIPVINVNIPNDGGATANPFFVVLNSTLQTQCDGIYKYIQRYYAIDPVVVFRKKGASEDQVKAYLDSYSKTTVSVPLKLKYIDLTDSFSVNQLKPYLDSTHRTVCIAGSLDVNFGKRLASQLASIYPKYPSVVIGMPTWDGLRDFSRPEFKGPEIVYSTPFYNAKTDKVSQNINNYFNNTMFSGQGIWCFAVVSNLALCEITLQYGKDLSSNLGNRQIRVFTDFDIQPVLNKQNHHLIISRIRNCILSSGRME
jgi:hypothetical protein